MHSILHVKIYHLWRLLYETLTLTSKTSSGKDDHELNHLQGGEVVLPLVTSMYWADRSQEVWKTYPELSWVSSTGSHKIVIV